jgi:2-methylcitrate dehydratase PrpD
MSTALRSLASFVATRCLDGEPLELRTQAAKLLADSAACIVSGAGSELAPALLRYARSGEPGKTPILGTSLSVGAESAAMVNGAFGHALEYDDVFSMLPGHPAVVMLAAMAGDVARRRVTGRELAEAFAIGYEACARLGMAMTLEHHRVRGFHATATLGLFGATAALARLRGVDAEQCMRALSVAASFASGLLAQIGTPMKSVHSGWAARSALIASELAAAGLTGAADALESPKGFFNAYGTAASRVERLLEDIGTPWAILRPGVSIKKYPCCFAAHRGIEAILMLKREHNLNFADIAAIECRLPPKGLVNMVHHRPQTGLEAKFSMEYCFVTTLMDGAPGLPAFTDARVRRVEAQAALPMVSCIEHEACEEGLGEASGEVSGARGHVQIDLLRHDGSRLVQRVAHAPGTPARELTGDELDHKIGQCAAHAGFSPEAAQSMRAELARWRLADDTVLSLAPLCPQS